MLVVARKSNEKIKLSNGIIISIEGLQPGRVRIGIEAPKSIAITRSNPCRVCSRPTFDYYLGYPDIPVCENPTCSYALAHEVAAPVNNR